MSDTRIYVALTSSCGSDAREMLQPLLGCPVGVKVGLELFLREGPPIVENLKDMGFPVFLDLKFHDIPYTVAGAVQSACTLEPDILNIHASGGMQMMKAAAEAVTGKTKLIAVTVLTSMDSEDLRLLGSESEPLEAVVRLAGAAHRCGLHGVVCSPLEASAVRKATDDDFLIVTPGVRPAGSASGDQKRIMTPCDAVKAGATALVVGRPITAASDPGAAVKAILSEIEQALKG
ncbi:orotidine-5'-phosphate decarboxylase [Candidatus Fermentibacteria bacterium]|nr:MAG: orotidine-5'-phosphate decarboxylase [Candidatus Fermentibacteria bacterium]